jgi:hypothetical protein
VVEEQEVRAGTGPRENDDDRDDDADDEAGALLRGPTVVGGADKAGLSKGWDLTGRPELARLAELTRLLPLRTELTELPWLLAELTGLLPELTLLLTELPELVRLTERLLWPGLPEPALLPELILLPGPALLSESAVLARLLDLAELTGLADVAVLTGLAGLLERALLAVSTLLTLFAGMALAGRIARAAGWAERARLAVGLWLLRWLAHGFLPVGRWLAVVPPSQKQPTARPLGARSRSGTQDRPGPARCGTRPVPW